MSENKVSSDPENLVLDIQNHKIYLKNLSNQILEAVMRFGGFQKEIAGQLVWLINYADDLDLSHKLLELNRFGFLFVGEPAGWPPAEVFDNLRKKGLLNEKFKEIRWRGPNDWYIVER